MGLIQRTQLGAAIALLFCVLWQPVIAQSTARCIIAAEHETRTYRTDTIKNCRIDLQSGSTTYTHKGKNKERSYDRKIPLTSKHINAVNRWMNARRRLTIDPQLNPVGLDLNSFLSEAAKATEGFVLVRKRKGKTAYNLVFITDGVYRLVDLTGTSLNSIPSGFMEARR